MKELNKRHHCPVFWKLGYIVMETPTDFLDLEMDDYSGRGT